MGFILSILLLVILGYYCNYFYIYKGKRAKNHAWAAIYSEIVVLVFLVGSILMYTNVLGFIPALFNNLPWMSGTEFLHGADFMWNGMRLIGISSNIAVTTDIHKIAVVLFFTYVPTYIFGKLFGEFMFGRRTYERGVSWGLS
jgi:hypothetical protein